MHTLISKQYEDLSRYRSCRIYRSQLLKYILTKHDDIRVVVLDALTYAGNLGTIASDIDNERCFFVKGDICDRDLADQLFAEYKFDYIVNLQQKAM